MLFALFIKAIENFREQALMLIFVVVAFLANGVYNLQTFAASDSVERLALKIEINHLETSVANNQRELWFLEDKKLNGKLTPNENDRLTVLKNTISRETRELSVLYTKKGEQ